MAFFFSSIKFNQIIKKKARQCPPQSCNEILGAHCPHINVLYRIYCMSKRFDNVINKYVSYTMFQKPAKKNPSLFFPHFNGFY